MESSDQPRQHVKKQRHHSAYKGPSSQSYGFSSSHVWMSELDHKEGWVPKNWCFWIVLLEMTLGSPLDCKEIQPVHPKGDQSWIFIGRNDADAETEAPVLWASSLEKTLMLGKIEGGRRRGRQNNRKAPTLEGWCGVLGWGFLVLWSVAVTLLDLSLSFPECGGLRLDSWGVPACSKVMDGDRPRLALVVPSDLSGEFWPCQSWDLSLLTHGRSSGKSHLLLS